MCVKDIYQKKKQMRLINKQRKIEMQEKKREEREKNNRGERINRITKKRR